MTRVCSGDRGLIVYQVYIDGRNCLDGHDLRGAECRGRAATSCSQSYNLAAQQQHQANTTRVWRCRRSLYAYAHIFVSRAYMPPPTTTWCQHNCSSALSMCVINGFMRNMLLSTAVEATAAAAAAVRFPRPAGSPFLPSSLACTKHAFYPAVCKLRCRHRLLTKRRFETLFTFLVDGSYGRFDGVECCRFDIEQNKTQELFFRRDTVRLCSQEGIFSVEATVLSGFVCELAMGLLLISSLLHSRFF